MAWRSRMVTLAILAAGSTASAERELAPQDLGWPANTTVAEARHRIRVLAGQGHGRHIGTIIPGAKISWKRIVAAHGECEAWVELEPHGYACAHDLAPTGDAPTADVAAMLPQERYAGVGDGGTDAYDDLQSIEDGTPARHLRDHTFLVIHPDRQPIRGFIKSDQGYVAEKVLTWYEPSSYEGIELPPGTPLDMGWAVARKAGAQIDVHATPDDAGAVVRKLARRERVTVLDQQAGFVKIGEAQWVDAFELRQPIVTARPDGITKTERWIDVDLDQQVLIAFEGDAPVFVTVVSSGINHSTPTGIYRIRGKDVRTRMQNPAEVPEGTAWNVADVPYSMRFRKNYALHGVYWHDGFGRARSQGCVNLSPHDAKRLYDWVTPVAPAGWTSVDGGSSDEHGTPVRIRSSRDPSPQWLDFHGEPIKSVR